MDIIITGKQGAGKTTQALNLAKGYGTRLHVFDYKKPLSYVLESLRRRPYELVIFDEVPHREILREALGVVHEYRRFSKEPITAIYCIQQETLNVVR